MKRLQEEHKLPAQMPVWLNADILAGPGNEISQHTISVNLRVTIVPT